MLFMFGKPRFCCRSDVAAYFFHKLSSLDNFEHQIGSHHIQINQFTQNCKINVTNLLYEHTIQPLHHGMLLILFSRFFYSVLVFI